LIGLAFVTALSPKHHFCSLLTQTAKVDVCNSYTRGFPIGVILATLKQYKHRAHNRVRTRRNKFNSCLLDIFITITNALYFRIIILTRKSFIFIYNTFTSCQLALFLIKIINLPKCTHTNSAFFRQYPTIIFCLHKRHLYIGLWFLFGYYLPVILSIFF